MTSFQKCRDPGSNRGPSDLQSDALPTELSRLVQTLCNIFVDGGTHWTFGVGIHGVYLPDHFFVLHSIGTFNE